jgi:DnaJ-class molecular chaperone
MEQNFYAILGITPWASARQIRQAYRELSKSYHPDTTDLDSNEAISKFQHLNTAYAMLSNPERRAEYDRTIQFSRFDYQPKFEQNPFVPSNWRYDDGLPSERPLSGGEIFSLALLLLTLLVCIAIAIAVALLRGDPLLPQP